MKILKIFLVLFLVSGFLHFVEPTAAAGSPKLVDHGTAYSAKIQTNQYKLDWKTYMYDKNTRKVFTTIYIQKQGKWKYLGKESILLHKMSKTTIKLSHININGFDLEPKYIKTKVSVREYYWNVFRQDMINGSICQYHKIFNSYFFRIYSI